MDSGHGRRLAAPEFSPAALVSHEESRGCALVSLREAMPTYVKELIAGGVAGGIAKTVVAPLERIKILYQTKYGNFQSLGLVRSLRFILNKEGIPGFFKGNGASVIRVVPYAALHFMTYEQYRLWILDHHPSASPGAAVDLFAGSMAGGTAVLSTYPLDLARTKLAYQVRDVSTGTTVYKGIGDVFSKVIRENGVKGLYRGIGPTLYGMLPYAGLKFYVYEKLKGALPNDHQSSLSSKLACGAVAGLIGQTFVYPLDVVRRQMQVQIDGLSTQRFTSTFDGLAHITRTQGMRQLFSGLSINYIKLVPSVAIGFATYDSMKSWLRVPPRENGQKTHVTS